MSSFEFLSVLISVVVGLGIANILTGVGRLIHRHKTVRVSVNFVAWTLYVFFYMVIYWWTVVFGWQEWQNWNLLLFFFVLSYGIVLYLLSIILFPTDMPEGWEPSDHLIVMRRWFFSVFLVLIVVEYTDSFLKDHLDEFSLPYYALMTTWTICGVAALISQSRRIHPLASVVVMISQVAWVSYQLADLEWVLSP